MAARSFSARELIQVAPAVAFAWVLDHRNVPRVLEGVSRWRPLGSNTGAPGARFDVEMSALGLPLENVLVLDRVEPDRAIGWRSESGVIRQTGGWTFRPRGAGTEVRLSISYEPPGGLVGGLVAGRVDGLIRKRLERALAAMKGILEGGDRG